MLELEKLRNKIDKIDNNIFNLINKRLKIVNRISSFKKKNNISCFDYKRENNIINNIINNNKLNNISKELIIDILKRIMYESYFHESDFKLNVKNNNIKITFIGGRGKMGNLFKNIFIKSGYNVSEINSNDWNNCKDKIKYSDLIIICSPISKYKEILSNISLYISDKTILLDILSYKENILKEMLNIHKGPVLSLHPMFGPDIKLLTKQTIICCNGRFKNKYKWLLKQFELWGVNIYYIKSNVHDNYMSYIQSIRYLNNYILGTFLLHENIDLQTIIDISPNINKIYLSSLGKFFSGDIDLYLEIIFSSQNNLLILEKYINHINFIFNKIKNKDKEYIIKLFENTKSTFNNNFNKLLKLNNKLSEFNIIQNII